ncbi:hypothetical protein HCDG_04051 [Histoplasma capsulatum H143]|uniref:Uncharacterized protein n=1 Tax=Ajellomyces capsulatus (strain H143) TaxID=544712 RepID=C6HCX0_AJECH|nr:hypothetical protein HCDG_04051 [Histoplasma capsulatum H143]
MRKIEKVRFGIQVRGRRVCFVLTFPPQSPYFIERITFFSSFVLPASFSQLRSPFSAFRHNYTEQRGVGVYICPFVYP